MAQAGAFGAKLGQPLNLKDAPSLITRTLRSAELAVVETRDDNPVPGLCGSLPSDDAYLVSLKFRDYPDCECWERGRCVITDQRRAIEKAAIGPSTREHRPLRHCRISLHEASSPHEQDPNATRNIVAALVEASILQE